MNEHFRINGSPTADGYYTTYSPNEVTLDKSSTDPDVPSGGGTSVGTRTVEGTLQQPFGDMSYTIVRDALKNNVGSALLTVTMDGDTATVPLFVQNNAVILNGTMTTRSSGNITGFQTYIALWQGVNISEFRLIVGSDGTYSAEDYTAMAKNLPTTLTFTYWGD